MLQREGLCYTEFMKTSLIASAGKLELIALLVGIVGAVLAGVFISWKYAPLVGWDIAGLTYLVCLWTALFGLSHEQTAALATREDPGRGVSDVLLVFASVFSLAAVGVLIFQAGNENGVLKITHGLLGFLSVVISWAVVHTVYSLKYARVYYKNKGGIDFYSTIPPRYSDFVYAAFTVGMTFQISDNNFTTNEFRRIAFRHALLSFLFGTIILGSAINFIASLGK